MNPLEMKKEFHLPVESQDKTALDLLSVHTGLSRQKIKQAMQKGCVWLEKGNYTQRLRRAKKGLSHGDVLHCYYDPDILKNTPPTATLVSDEGDYSIWIKPSGMFSQGSKWGDHCTIYRWAEKNLKPERPAFIVHRLDRAASGLIILAHKKKIAAKFAKMFREHRIDKQYDVTVEGDFHVVLSAKQEIKTISRTLDGKPAVSHVRFIHYNEKENHSILEVHIETGRKHQIRRHLASLNFPVVGDRLYGTNEYASSGKQVLNLQLKAQSLSFDCPVTGVKKSFKF